MGLEKVIRDWGLFLTWALSEGLYLRPSALGQPPWSDGLELPEGKCGDMTREREIVGTLGHTSDRTSHNMAKQARVLA